jgi:pimeloyl-ACP methyl ester carboxylesterase
MRNQPRLFRVSGSGLTLQGREWNAGSPGVPIVLLHGITGSGADWARVVPGLGPGRVIALDARGHGASDWDAAEGYGADQHFADVSAALDSLQIEQCLLAGFSMGGTVAMLTAACLPERVAGVAVIDSYPHPAMSKGSRLIARWISNSDDSPRSFDPAIARQFRFMLAEGHAQRLDLRTMWASIDCPALVVRGAASDVLTSELAADMLATQRLARVVTIPGVGHGIPRYQPGELGVALATFVASCAENVLERALRSHV